MTEPMTRSSRRTGRARLTQCPPRRAARDHRRRARIDGCGTGPDAATDPAQQTGSSLPVTTRRAGTRRLIARHAVID